MKYFILSSESVPSEVKLSLKNKACLNPKIYYQVIIDKYGVIRTDSLIKQYICDLSYGVSMTGKMVLKTRALALTIDANCDFHCDFLQLCCLLLDNGTLIVFRETCPNEVVKFIKTTCTGRINNPIELDWNPFEK